jgi:hypothetical protein
MYYIPEIILWRNANMFIDVCNNSVNTRVGNQLLLAVKALPLEVIYLAYTRGDPNFPELLQKFI